MLKCLSCGGTYEKILRDGSRYDHVCPPLPAVEVSRAGRTIVVLPAQVRPSDVTLGDAALPRPNARDERVDRAKALAARTEDGTRTKGVTDADLMRAAGQGVEELP